MIAPPTPLLLIQQPCLSRPAGTVTFEYRRFDNPARSDGLQLTHWVKCFRDAANRVTPAESDYSFAKYNKQVLVGIGVMGLVSGARVGEEGSFVHCKCFGDAGRLTPGDADCSFAKHNKQVRGGGGCGRVRGVFVCCVCVCGRGRDFT